VNNNLKKLNKKLEEKEIDFFLISTTDEFLNEYVPARNMRLKWLINFSGSNGIALISRKEKYFFTDGRYILQAKKEINKEFKIFDLALIDFFTFARDKIKKKTILVDFRIFKIDFMKKLFRVAESNSNKIIHDKNNIIDRIWLNRPAEIIKNFFFLDKRIVGQNIYEKQRTLFKINDNDIIIITSPESVCWFLNIRGFDLPHTPIVFSRAIISRAEIKLFIDKEKVPEESFDIENLKIFQLKNFEEQIIRLPKNKRIFMDNMSSFYYYDFLVKRNFKPVIGTDPCKIIKSQKNNSEIRWSRKAHLYDGVSLVKFFYWLDNEDFNIKVTEFYVSKKLENYRKEIKSFFSTSFPTISAVGANGSIIHYNPKKRSNRLEKGKLYLCDSGGQYYGGTTDVTRTIFLGDSKPNKEFISNYTKVLLGHISISMMKFPEGTKGHQIDSIARYYLWQDGMDYNHGTGHGVGSFLGVHEGPQSISKRFNNFVLKEGMILSNEPGFYKRKKYGIRIENLVLVKKSRLKGFLEFETLTLFPYEHRLIDKSLLSDSHKKWINSYHERVYYRLSNFLSKHLRDWLKKKVKRI